MTHIELPRPLEAYFAFAELPSGRDARRFTITFTYLERGKLDRLQWWWQASHGQLRVGGEFTLDSLRKEAIARFRAHIETWLVNSHRRLTGGNPFPNLEIVSAPLSAPLAAPAPATAPAPTGAAGVVPLGAARTKGQAA